MQCLIVVRCSILCYIWIQIHKYNSLFLSLYPCLSLQYFNKFKNLKIHKSELPPMPSPTWFGLSNLYMQIIKVTLQIQKVTVLIIEFRQPECIWTINNSHNLEASLSQQKLSTNNTSMSNTKNIKIWHS